MRTSNLRLVIAFSATAVFASFLTGGSALAADKPKLPEGPGREVTEKLCGTCHGVGILMSKRESRDGWSGIVEDMIQRGAKGTDEEFGESVDYLATHFSKSAPPPKIRVNEAGSKELASLLGVPADQGTAIVQYRETKGAFKAVEDLLKVPGLDAQVIEAKKARLQF